MSDSTIEVITVITISCMALNCCLWLYGKTLSEAFPALVVIIIMLGTIFGFFISFKLLMVEVCNNIFSPDWGYLNENNHFVSFTKNIAHMLAGVLTVGIAFLIYKDEGKIKHSK